MDEEKLKAKMTRMSVITVIVSIVLTVAGIVVWQYVEARAYSSEQEQMRVETNEYGERLLKQLDKNLQVLTTLSKVYEIGMLEDDMSVLQDTLSAANEVNDFLTVAYIRTDGTGVINIVGRTLWDDISLDECPEYVASAIQTALEGENAISKLFDSEIYNEKLFAYAVPVYNGEEVVGALAASDNLEIFEDVANGRAVMGGSGYIHLINADGEFLVRSENSPVSRDVKNIYDGGIFSENTRQLVSFALQNGRDAEGEYSYGGSHYHFFMQPLNINNWYLFCVDVVWGTNSFAGGMLTAFGIIIVLLVALVNVLLFGSRHLFKKHTNELIRVAYTDPVTGSANSAKFERNMQQVIREHKPMSTVALNVHNFNGINDLFGRQRADTVLIYIAKVIEHSLERGEFFCRDTADLFFILMLETDTERITKRLQSIIDLVRKMSNVYDNYGYDISLYIGVAVNGDREKALLAMQSIHNTHTREIAFYNSDMHEAVRRKNSIEGQMESALKNCEFKLFLQPKLDMKTLKPSGAEALVRWINPDGSYRSPAEFIPLFEANGFCFKLDMYMFELVCAQIKKWIDEGSKPLPISVNQSKLLFMDRNYPDKLMKIINKYEVPTSLITLEILESVASDNLEYLNHQIEVLHKKGFKISLDDFGTGYSSLNMLYLLKIDEMKLDKGFLRKISADGEDRRRIILEQITKFARELGISTVAEGIETKEDEKLVLSIGCDCGQGFLYDKPMPADDFSSKYIKG